MTSLKLGKMVFVLKLAPGYAHDLRPVLSEYILCGSHLPCGGHVYDIPVTCNQHMMCP